MTTTIDGLEFDPGFAPYILVFSGSVEYIYSDINRFKNLSQKKMKFRQYYKKMIDIFYNNIGFYVGCLMWAAYIKAQPEQPILSNHCLGQEYDEQENIQDTQFMLKFTELLPKDIKYYLGENFIFEDKFVNLIKVYEEFLVLNKGFVNSEKNTDIVLPGAVKLEKLDRFKSLIDEAIKEGNLAKLVDNIPDII